MSSETPSLTELEGQLKALQQGHNNAWDAIEDLQDQMQEIRAEQRRIQEGQTDLQASIEQIDTRTDLLRLVESSDEMSGKQRSVALIQHLRRAAMRERERGRTAKASLNREEAERALQYPAIDRTTVYTDMDRAERLVGDRDVLWYESNSSGRSRLKLNLEAGDLPTEVVGQHGGR
ncbi:hypothetical protein [Halobellus rarus]|uniref:Uncharacterized protein n=1 Tax=Halobellus rarus TaxID=1126237 RepID=A0ABD6CUI6_9EURY|nr:hypothetical protein [Halobellus rarus]